MKPLLLVPLLCLASCVGVRAPRLSMLHDAPDSVRDAIELDLTVTPPNIHCDFIIYTPPEAGEWIDLNITVENNRVFAEGHFAYNDDDKFVPVERLLVDTGYNGYLNFPLGHGAVEQAWLSAELGRTESATLTGRRAAWTGAGSCFAIAGILISPIPLVVTGVAGGDHRTTPLLGQLWFDLAEATWIDLTTETIAVSFEMHSPRDAISGNPDAWIEVPWRGAKPDSHRFVPIRVGEQVYDAVIDTGSVGEILLDTPHPPSFVEKPWGRATLNGARSGSVFHAMSTVPVWLGGFKVDKAEIAWLSRPSTVFADTPSGRPFAVLGVPFLRRFPVLLDPRNDRAYFFIGDRADLPSFAQPDAEPAP